MNDGHITNEQLQLLLDRTLVPDDRIVVERHLYSCVTCRRAFSSLQKLDISLRALPVEHVSTDFTRTVLASLNIAPRTPFLFKIVEHLSYVFGLVLVLGIMLSAFLVTGVINRAQITETQSTFSNYGKAFGQQVDSFAASLTTLLQSYLPFVFGGGNLKIALMSSLAIGMLVVADKFLKRRFHV